jgi:hypothetical protein
MSRLPTHGGFLRLLLNSTLQTVRLTDYQRNSAWTVFLPKRFCTGYCPTAASRTACSAPPSLKKSDLPDNSALWLCICWCVLDQKSMGDLLLTGALKVFPNSPSTSDSMYNFWFV